MRSLRGATWNCRLLWGHNETDTIHHALKLARVHDFTILTETRQTAERLAFLKGKITNDLVVYTSEITQYRGGICMLVSNTFIDMFSSVTWNVMEEGRLARLELSGPQGTLHKSSVYLHPSCPPSQAADIRMLARSLDANAHNLICGDFNFALHSYDRISKFDASCTGESDRDKA